MSRNMTDRERQADEDARMKAIDDRLIAEDQRRAEKREQANPPWTYMDDVDFRIWLAMHNHYD